MIRSLTSGSQAVRGMCESMMREALAEIDNPDVFTADSGFVGQDAYDAAEEDRLDVMCRDVAQELAEKITAMYPELGDGDFDVTCSPAGDGAKISVEIYDADLADSGVFGRGLVSKMKEFGCSGVAKAGQAWTGTLPASRVSSLGESGDIWDDDCYEGDFPTWALDYAVNAELGSVSRQEKEQIDQWFDMMREQGYDTGTADYGDEEFFSSSPEFGLPCECVGIRVCRK